MTDLGLIEENILKIEPEKFNLLRSYKVKEDRFKKIAVSEKKTLQREEQIKELVSLEATVQEKGPLAI